MTGTGTGAWKLENMEPCNLPERVATGFTDLFNSLTGASYMPVLYCAEQLVNGTNHMLICKQTLSTAQPIEHLTKVIIHEPLPKNPSDEWSIKSIEALI